MFRPSLDSFFVWISGLAPVKHDLWFKKKSAVVKFQYEFTCQNIMSCQSNLVFDPFHKVNQSEAKVKMCFIEKCVLCIWPTVFYAPGEISQDQWAAVSGEHHQMGAGQMIGETREPKETHPEMWR